MPSLPKLHIAGPADQAVPTSSERFTHALVGLTRKVWHPDCTFETALGAICETAASALEVDRVSVWHYDREAGLLRCLNAYGASEGAHMRAEELETLSLDGDDYMAALQDVRTFEADEVEVGAARPRSHGALRDYLHRHRIHALLDAPACILGELQGVICHESIDRGREWTQEEITFAASMGDYVAMAYEIARRRRAETEVAHLRLHDATTGLPNRDYMVELLAQRLLTPRCASETLAVVHVRIDASSGLALSADAPTVDEIMGRIAQRLRRFTSNDVALARVRSDGFAFLLAHEAGQGTVVRLAERCLGAVRAVEWHHAEVDPGAAVGVAFAGPVAYTDARVLMRQAEEAAERPGPATSTPMRSSTSNTTTPWSNDCGSSAPCATRLRTATSGFITSPSTTRPRGSGWPRRRCCDGRTAIAWSLPLSSSTSPNPPD